MMTTMSEDDGNEQEEIGASKLSQKITIFWWRGKVSPCWRGLSSLPSHQRQRLHPCKISSTSSGALLSLLSISRTSHLYWATPGDLLATRIFGPCAYHFITGLDLPWVKYWCLKDSDDWFFHLLPRAFLHAKFLCCIVICVCVVVVPSWKSKHD